MPVSPVFCGRFVSLRICVYCALFLCCELTHPKEFSSGWKRKFFMVLNGGHLVYYETEEVVDAVNPTAHAHARLHSVLPVLTLSHRCLA
jgi:hypothetical protein